MNPSPALTQCARHKAEKLQKLCPDLLSWRACIELPHKHSLHGRPVSVRIEVALPGHALAVSHVADEDAYLALRHAFHGMAQQLEHLA